VISNDLWSRLDGPPLLQTQPLRPDGRADPRRPRDRAVRGGGRNPGRLRRRPRRTRRPRLRRRPRPLPPARRHAPRPARRTSRMAPARAGRRGDATRHARSPRPPPTR
jgi:hypothetical protein